jgi:hypothetical protein
VKWRVLASGAALCAAVALGWSASTSFSTPPHDEHKLGAASATVVPANATGVAMPMEATLPAVVPSVPPQRVRSASERSARYIASLWEGRDRFDRERERRALFEEMARDEGVVSAFVDAFARSGSAQEAFGAQHREARVLGVRFLRFLDEGGNTAPLRAALAGAAARLEAGDDTRGLEKDIEDLARQYALGHADELDTSPSSFAGHMGIKPAARAAMAQGVFDGLSREPATMKARWQAASTFIYVDDNQGRGT